MLDKFATPHQIELLIKKKGAMNKIMNYMKVGNDTIPLGLNASIYPQDVTANVFEEFCAMPFPATDVQHGADT